MEMRRRFYEDQRIENKAKADGLVEKLIMDSVNPLADLAEDFYKLKKPLIDEFDDLTAQPKAQEPKQKYPLEQVDSLIKKLDELIIGFDKKMAEVSGKTLSVLESFDALPENDKGTLYRANDRLKEVLDTAKKNFILCKKRKAFALQQKAQMWNAHILWEYKLLQPKNSPLRQEASSTNHSGTKQNEKDVEEIIADFDKLTQLSMSTAAEGIEGIQEYDKLHSDPFLMKDHQQRKNFEQSATEARIRNSFPYLVAMGCVKKKSHLHMKLVMLDNKELQGNENLQNWHALAESLITKEYALVEAVSRTLILDESTAVKNVGKLSREEVQVRLEAAREGQSQFEKAIRICEKIIKGYEKLEGVVKDDRMTSSLQELKTAMEAFLQAREFAVQFWTDKQQELEDKNDAFLPANLQSKSSQKKANKKLASQQPSEPPESSRQPGFHKTTEGVVFGRVTEQGELKGLDENGNVIATYFKDQDSDKWVKDYGDEANVPQSISTVAPVASGKTTAVREKIERIVLKADNITKASLRFARDRVSKATNSSDYDEKFNLLNHAHSERLKAIRALRGLLVDLEFELKESPAQDLPGKKWMAELNAHLARLQEDTQELGKQVAQAKKELDHHTFKGRNPTGTTFEALLEQGQVASVKKAFNRQQSYKNEDDWLDRYVIYFAKGAQGEEYDPWIVHAHYKSDAAHAAPARVHMKLNEDKDKGVEQPTYHSPPLSEAIFNLVKQEAQKQEAPSVSAKKGNRKRR